MSRSTVVAMDRAGWLDRIRQSMIGCWGTMAEASEGGRTWRRDGVFASVMPVTPERSVMNSVIFFDPGELLGSLDELGGVYDEAGIEAWTVWVPEGDEETERALAAAGHTFDAEPCAMGIELALDSQPELSGIDWFRDCDMLTLSRVNDAAYGYEEGSFERALRTVPADGVHTYAARANGEVAAVLMTEDVDNDTEVAWVATTEAARGRGLATALMRQSLWDAQERGSRTATLQATKLGEPVYRRVGFEDFGALHMWERRKT